jgi:hypothetical protein
MAQQEWFIDVQGTPYGPYTAAQLREFAANGQLFPTTNLMLGSHGKWMPASRVAALFPPVDHAPPIVAAPVAAPAFMAMQTPQFITPTGSGSKTPSSDAVGTPVLACGLIGAGLLVAGVFMPLIQAPFIGSVNYFTIAKVDSSIIIGGAIAAAVAILLKVTWPAVSGGLVALGFLINRLTNFQMAMAHARGNLEKDLGDNPFAGMASAMAEATGIQWGFAVLVLGSLALIVAPMFREFRKPAARTNSIISGLGLAFIVVLGVGGITYLVRIENGGGLVGGATSDKSSISNSVEGKAGPRTSTPGVFSALTNATEKSDSAEENAVTLGQTIQLGNLKITPRSATKRSITVRQIYDIKSKGGVLEGPFIVITADVENISEGQVFDPFPTAEGIDNYGNELKSLETLTKVIDPDAGYGDLKPGERKTVAIVLEPKNLDAKWFRIRVLQWVDNRKTTGRWSIRLSND